MQLVEEDVEDRERQPERRNRDAAEAEDPDELVGEAIVSERREEAEPDPDDDREDDHEDRELGRGGEGDREVLRHRVVGLGRDAEVALEQVAEVHEVLHDHRLVEALRLAELRDDGRIARRPLPQRGLRRVGGHQVGEREGDERDAEDQQDADTQAERDVADERGEAPALVGDESGGRGRLQGRAT